jgi:hypothetical protein
MRDELSDADLEAVAGGKARQKPPAPVGVVKGRAPERLAEMPKPVLPASSGEGCHGGACPRK